MSEDRATIQSRRICRKCNKPMALSDKVCPHCGEDQAAAQAKVTTDLSTETIQSTRLCKQCRKALKPGQMKCDACGTEVAQPKATGDVSTETIQSARLCRQCRKAMKPGQDRCDACGAETQKPPPDPRAKGPAAEDPRIGKVIADRYRIDSLLGAGGMGRVYRGTHIKLGEPVAIKFLLSEWTQRAEANMRFKREAVALAKLRHPGIVAIHDFGEVDGELYMAMELVRGKPMADLLEGDPIPVERALNLIDLTLQVVEMAHAEGIVHRDLKGENVMVLDLADGVDHVKVLDFGLALMNDTEGSKRLTATEAVHGTPLYMSPEQIRGRDVGPPTDIYAVGVMLFEMLAGALPFDGATIADVMVKHLHVEPPRIEARGVRRKVPEALESLVQWAMAKDAADRPTAHEFREALAQARAGTDPASKNERAQRAREAAAGMSRADRAVGATGSGGVPEKVLESGKSVVLWGFEPARASALGSLLAVQGLQVLEHGDATPPGEKLRGRKVGLVALPALEGVAERVRSLRAAADSKKLPVLVVDAASTATTPALIRAGASDIAYQSTRDPQLCQQLVQLLRKSS